MSKQQQHLCNQRHMSHLMRLHLVHACVLRGNSMDCLFRILSILCCASHSSDMPGLRWSTETSSQFWSCRSTTVIARLPRVHQRNAERIHHVAQRDAARRQRREEFVQRYRKRAVPGTPSILDTEEIRDLRFWSQHQAWTYCASCGALQPQKLLPSYRRRPPMKASRTCNCRTQRYVLPNEDDTPLSLQGLTDEQIRALRPLDIHTGEYRRMQHGYRARTSSFRVTWSVTSVEEKIHNLHPASSRQAAQRAYDAVMRSPQSRYREFMQMRNSNVRDPFPYEIFSNPMFTGIECTLWSHLYYNTSLCESTLQGSEVL